MVCNNPIGLLLNLITFCVSQNHFYLRLHSFGLFFFFCFLSKVLMYFSNIFCGTPKQHLTIRFKNDKRNTTFFFHFASSSSVQAISWTFFSAFRELSIEENIYCNFFLLDTKDQNVSSLLSKTGLCYCFYFVIFFPTHILMMMLLSNANVMC